MKILQVNCVYESGSTGKLVKYLHEGLQARGHDSIVCYGRGSVSADPKTIKVCGETYAKANHLISRVSGIMYGGCGASTERVMSLIRKERPDVVHLQCINGYFVNIYKLVEWLRANHINTVLTLHAEFMYTGGCSHAYDCSHWEEEEGCGDCPIWKIATQSWFGDRTAGMWSRMRSAFKGFDDRLIVCSVSPWLMDRAERSVILRDKQHRVVLNGIDTKIFLPRETKELREQMRLGDKKILFYATPHFSQEKGHVKGGWYVTELARRLSSSDKDTVILIAGPYEKTREFPANMIFLGKVEDQELLAKYYSMADVTLMTSRRETFSLVTAESLCCGTPVVGFKAGGPESVALKDHSRFVEFGDVDALIQAVNELLQMDPDTSAISREAAIYSKERMIDEYIDIYKSMER